MIPVIDIFAGPGGLVVGTLDDPSIGFIKTL